MMCDTKIPRFSYCNRDYITTVKCVSNFPHQPTLPTHKTNHYHIYYIFYMPTESSRLIIRR